MLLTPERTMRRKVQEIILARQLSQKLSKEDVLALYLNQIYYGHGRYGCEEAARYFFGKSVREVSLAEAALLAGLPQSPERLSPRKHPEAAKTRQRYVLGQLAERGYIDRKLADKVAAEPIRLAREPSSARGTAVEAVDATARFLVDKLGERAAFESGTTVATTIDARLQELARAALERGLEELDARQGFRGPSGHLIGEAAGEEAARSGEGVPEAQGIGHRRGDGGPRRARGRPEGGGLEDGRPKGAQDCAAVRRHRRRRGQGGGGRRQPRAPLREGDQAVRRAVQAGRPGAGARRKRAVAQRGRPDAAGAGAGAAGGDGGDGAGHPRGSGPGRRIRLPPRRLRSRGARAPAARLGLQAHLLRGGGGVAADHAGDDHQRLARRLRRLEARQLREGGVPRPGPHPHRAGALDQHRLDQDPVRSGRRSGARVRGPHRHHLGDQARRRAGAGAGGVVGDAQGDGQRLRDLRQRRLRRPADL